MALYIGNTRVKIHFGAVKDNNIQTTVHKLWIGEPLINKEDDVFSGILTKTTDAKLIKTSNGLYLTVKKEAN